MIFNMSGGGVSLNFKVVGGTSQPADMLENIIWVNTSVAITGYVFDTVQPVGSAGHIWIDTSDCSISLNAIKKNTVQLCLNRCRQYINNKWAPLDAYVCQSGVLTQFSWKYTYLYKPGDICEALTGGWTMTGLKYQSSSGGNAEAPDLVTGTTYIKIYHNNSREWESGLGRTTKNIDLSKYSTIRVKGTTHDAGNGWLYFNVWTSIGTYTQSNTVVRQSLSAGTLDLSVDISSLTSSYYIGFEIMSGSSGSGEVGVTITEMWLEE